MTNNNNILDLPAAAARPARNAHILGYAALADGIEAPLEHPEFLELVEAINARWSSPLLAGGFAQDAAAAYRAGYAQAQADAA